MGEADVVVQVTRGHTVESQHRGFIAAVDGQGRTIAKLGDIETVTYLRSSAKPFQALAVVGAGAADRFGFTDKEQAIMIGSHSGQPFHVQAVISLLEKIGLSESALRCGAHPPFDPKSAADLDGPPTAIHNNCSGKHAGMLALALHLGADPSTYDQIHHPVQQCILEVLAQFDGLNPQHISIGVDGCGAPNFALPIRNMAWAYAQLVANQRQSDPKGLGAAAGRVIRTMIEHPDMIAGTHGRLDTDLMMAVPSRLISKVGAEGVHTVGLLPNPEFPHGLGLALKIEAGDDRRVSGMVVLESLRQLRALDQPALDRLKLHGPRPVLNHRGEPVGHIRPAFQLEFSQ